MKTKNLILENLNPEGKSEGDCVLRAITKVESDKTYEQIRQEIVKDNEDKYCYRIPVVYEKYLFELGYLEALGNGLVNKKSDFTRYGITTFNMAALLSKAIGTPILAISYSHMVAVMPDGKIYDSWDSGKKRVFSLYIKDAGKLFDGLNWSEHWFERRPNGEAILRHYTTNEEVAAWKDGVRIR